MAIRYHYTKTSLASVSATLAKFFGALESEKVNFSRAASSNMIIPLSSSAELEKIEETIDSFSLVHASRFFIVYVDPKLTSIEAEVSARCHALSKTEHVCSEVIRIGYPPNLLDAVPSLIRANLITGMVTEFYLHDPSVSLSALRTFASLADSTIFDSGDFEANFSSVGDISHLTRSALDLQWVGLGLWRDEIKDLFGRPLVREYIPTVRSIEITSNTRAPQAAAACSLLLAAWIFDRLKLTSNVRATPQGYEVAMSDKHMLKLALHATPQTASSALAEVLFRFDPLRIGDITQDQYIRISAAESLETMVDLNISYRSTRLFDDESRLGRIRRYFLIGESVTNYTSALQGALRLAQLRAQNL